MKLKYFLMAAPLLALGLASCGGHTEKATGDSGDAITEFDINQKLVSADKNYRVETDYGTVYLEMYTSVQWPEKLGGNDISVLRDSLMNFAYNDTTSTSVRDAVKRFLNDTSIVEGATNITPVDTLPADSMTYFTSVTANVLDLDEEMVTYQVVTSQYMGGAHPLTATRPFTYDFAQKAVLDFSNIFRQGVSSDSIMPIITEALARQLSVPVRGLERAGIFVSQLTYPGKPYISNNTLYFHYDPYEIGPYSLGAVDVAVYPYEVDRFLQPAVKKLFDQGF